MAEEEETKVTTMEVDDEKGVGIVGVLVFWILILFYSCSC